MGQGSGQVYSHKKAQKAQNDFLRLELLIRRTELHNARNGGTPSYFAYSVD
jgi:hypothetical protein